MYITIDSKSFLTFVLWLILQIIYKMIYKIYCI